MAWNDSSEIVVANNGQIYVAPVGTALPTTTATALNAAFNGLGYTTEDGVKLTATPDFQGFKAWQSRQEVRRELVNQEIMVEFELLQQNDFTIPLAFGGGTVVDLGSSKYRYDFPSATSVLDERAMVIDTIDGTKTTRIVIPRGLVNDSVTTSFNRNGMATLPITFGALQPADGSSSAFMLFDDATAYAVGS